MISNEFRRRRRALMRMMEPQSIAILPAAPLSIRNRDVHYPYRPDSDFYYLTGFPEPESVAVLIPGREQAEYAASGMKSGSAGMGQSPGRMGR
jgi:Xaa-Pro aminopeptidase